MSTTTTPIMYPTDNCSSVLNSMQNQNLASDIFGVSKDVMASTGQITGTVQSLNLSSRDSTDRNTHAINNSINSTAQVTQTGVERTAATTQSGIERTAGGIQASIGSGVGSILTNEERIAAENRITTLQSMSDSQNLWAGQTRDILNLVNDSSFQTRLLLSTGFSSILCDQAKTKEYLSHQLSENKYEDLKNQNVLMMQLADVKTQNALLMAEAKYEALKTQNVLSSQISECCCELKSTIHAVDDARIRDDLNRSRIVNELRNGYGGNSLGNAVVGGIGLSIGETLAGNLGFSSLSGNILGARRI